MGALTEDDLLGDRLLTALEEMEAAHRLAAPVTGANTATGIVSATFCVTATDAYDAATRATALFREALKAAGVPGDAHLEELTVTEDHEEAATAV